MSTSSGNPYVGPRSFRKEEATKFFGRENEARDLLSLVISEQLVMFYAQSGAGKSSLINTRLIPGLETRNFEVLPVGRVSSAYMDSSSVDNIYIFNLLQSLDQSGRDPRRFARTRLVDFLNNLTYNGSQFFYSDRASELLPETGSFVPIELLPRALIIDQFEEIISTHPEAWQKREDFFRQLAEAMRADPYLWVVLVMREDYIAALDPYAHLLPGQLRARYYMRRMGVEAALDAIRKPVENVRPYEPGVPELLVDNMRLISTAKVPGRVDQLLYGEFIEPVQLQVVCYQLWERIQQARGANTPASITKNDLMAIAKGENITQFISNALAEFYEQAIAKVLKNPRIQVQERELRDWFTHKLITEAETRGFVYRGAETTAGLPNAAVDSLASEYIIRSESKAGGVWIELVHDRFVGPILQSNRSWEARHQKSVLTDATAWKKSRQPDHLLYDGKQLQSSLAELESHPERFSALEKEFIRASQRTAERRRRRVSITLGIAIFLVIFTLAGMLVFSITSAVEARASAAEAQTQSANAIRLATSQAGSADRYLLLLSTQDAQIATLQVMEPVQATSTSEVATAVSTLLSTSTPAPSLINEKVIGLSAGNRELIAYEFGSGDRHVVLIGGLHAGFAPSTVIMAERMKEYLTQNLDIIPANITVNLITIANPDSLPPSGRDYAGIIEGRLNANGVDLNRNWGCDWKEEAVWRNNPISGGKTPFSEPETAALRDYLIVNKLTVAVVFWEARDIPPSVSPGGCGDFSVYSDPLSRAYADAAGYRAQDFIAYAINGDGTNWLDSQGIGAITVLLPSYTDLSAADFEANLNAVKQTLRLYGR